MQQVQTASWGPYHIALLVDRRHNRWQAVIRRSADKSLLCQSSEMGTVDAVKQWAGTTLEVLGCQALVDGRKRNLVDFLVFEQNSLGSI
jgi:hypothetical protein